MRGPISIALSLVALLAAVQRFEPFVAVGVWYDGLHLPRVSVLRDLQTIRALGFNHVTVPAAWGAIEPRRGVYHLQPLGALLALIADSGLKFAVQAEPEPRPAWLERGAADAESFLEFLDAVTSHGTKFPGYHVQPRVDRFRFSLEDVRGQRGSSGVPLLSLLRLDAIRSAAGERGWNAELEVAASTTAEDLRHWSWTSLAHGARGLTYRPWYAPESVGGDAGGLAGRDGMPGAHARAAGELAGIVARNAALFAPLRPHPARAAIVYDPTSALLHIGAQTAAQRRLLDMYERALRRNIRVDVISPADVAAGALSRYAVVLVPSPSTLPASATQALEAHHAAGGRVIRSADDVDREAMLAPEVGVQGGTAVVQAGFLESADAIVFIAVNHGDAPQSATFRFRPGTPEAIWQNMETGASVNFVQGPDGLTHRHTFRPRDALVLMIRKHLR